MHLCFLEDYCSGYWHQLQANTWWCEILHVSFLQHSRLLSCAGDPGPRQYWPLRPSKPTAITHFIVKHWQMNVGFFYICYIGKKLGDFKNRGNKKKYQYQNRWQVRKSGGVIPSLCSQTAQGKKIFALACFPFKNCLHPIWRARTTRILAGHGKNKNIVIVLSWN